MKIALVTSGTRGDVQPMVVVGAELARRGHDVSLGVPPNLVDTGLRCGLRSSSFGPDTQAFMESAEGQRWLAAGDVRTFMDEMMAVSTSVFPETMRELQEMADGAELIVGGILAEDLALPMAEKLGAPYASLHSAPYRRTRAFPQFMVTTRRLPGPLNRATGALFDRVWWKGVSGEVAMFRQELGLPADPTPTARKLVDGGRLELQAYSPSLVSGISDYGPRRPLIGVPVPSPELRRELADAPVGGRLEEWLAAGEAPVYVGMGSMPIANPVATLDMVTTASRRLGLRAVVSAGWSQLASSESDDVLVVGAVDHESLLPRCRAAVHHGGIGTTTASLSAGLPTLICSVFADQPFWGTHLTRLGVGAHVPFAQLDAAALERGLGTLLEPDTIERAAALGERLRAEPSAAEAAADRLEALVGSVRPDRGSEAPR